MTSYTHWRLETDASGIAWCHLDVQGSSTNVLSGAVLEEFSGLLEDLARDKPKGLIILSDKDNGFIAGADIREFTTIQGEDDARVLLERGHAAFNRLDALPFPTLALIHGFCLGGGLELALACDYRIALEDDKTRLGLPEVMLGIHPGFGGTARLIRLLGPLKALPLMLQGRTLDARRAKKLGLVDYMVPERQFLESAPQLILRRPGRARAGKAAALVNKWPLRQLAAAYMRRQLEKKVRAAHYPAPYALLSLWERHGDDEKAMLNAEIDSVAKLAGNDASRNLVRVYLLQERLKSLAQGADFAPDNIQVVGAGIMGGDIASWCVLQGMTAGLQDREPRFIAPAIQRAYKLYTRRLKHPRLVQRAMDRLIPDLASRNTAHADVVIEAIIENADAKVQVFKQLEPRLKPDAVLATNTSSIALESLSRDLADPGRLVGIHFFNPVAKMQLVEIVHAPGTAPVWVEKAAAFCRRIGRLPLPVKSSPGFLVNRILTPYLMEAMQLHEEGVAPETIDRVAVGFGMPMGPVELADAVGLDICLSVAENLKDKLSLNVPEALRRKVGKGELGRKSGGGFYRYVKGKPQRRQVPAPGGDTREGIEDRLVMRLLNESAACLREGIVEDADLLDAGMIFGTGFAPFRGGPMHYAETRGYQDVVDRLESLAARHGERFQPDDYWRTLTSG